jgi:hypothetical protein
VKVDEPIEGSKITFEGVEVDIKGNGYVLIAPSFVKTKYQIIEGDFQDLQTNKKEKLIKTLTEMGAKKQRNKKHLQLTKGIFNNVVGVSLSSVGVKPLLKRDGKVFVKRFDELFTTFLGWRILSEKFHLDFPLELHKSFRSIPVLHGGKEDKKPSAELFRHENGSIIYRDFRMHRAYTLPEVYHALKTNKAPLLKEKELREKRLSQWTAEMMEDLNIYIYIQDALDYFEALNKFIDEAVKREKMPERFVRVWRRIADKMLRAYDHGGDICTARWLERETGVDHKKANKALNVLVACGVLRKGEEIILMVDGKKRKTQIIEPVKDFDIVDALRILSLIHEDLRKRKCGWDKFSRKAVINVLSKAVAETIFTRDRDRKAKEIRKEPKKEVQKKPAKSFWSYGGIFEKHMRKSVEELLSKNLNTPLSVSYMKDIKYPCKRSCYQKLKRQIEKETTVSFSG